MQRKGVELNWPSKHGVSDKITSIKNVNLPFQVVETVNETKATREAKKSHGLQKTLYDLWSNGEGETFDSGWKNKLIWGDNKYVMYSLLQKFAGKIDLIYIDPPFATGADFSVSVSINATTSIDKEPTAIEQKVYRDTWGRGMESYLDMMYERLSLMHQLLSRKGSIYVHLDSRVSHYLKVILDEIFGKENFVNDIIWKRTHAHSGTIGYGPVHDTILFYSKSGDYTWHTQHTAYSDEYVENFFRFKDPNGKKYRATILTGSGIRGGSSGKPWRGIDPTRKGRHWAIPGYVKPLLGIDDVSNVQAALEKLDEMGRILWPEKRGGVPSFKQYIDDMPGVDLQDIWTDIPPISAQANERLGYPTQKPEPLLERIIRASSDEGDLVADFFCGSGTALAVAEKLKRRWIGCDIGRFAIHTARKRLMEIENCKPFEILNLGKYERQIWQESSFTMGNQTVLYEYLAFILRLYGAEPIAGFQQIHGRKGKALIHIGSVDAPVTIDEVASAMTECASARQTELHILGWEWEMGIHDLIEKEARQAGIKLRLLTIPNEVMETSAVEKGDITFFDLAYVKADVSKSGKTVQVELQDFVIPNTELIPDEIRAKISRWSDLIDYWAIDFDFQNDTFMNNWTAYRTKEIPKLTIKSDPYTYQQHGKHKIVVKVIDIFGIDTSQAFEVEV